MNVRLNHKRKYYLQRRPGHNVRRHLLVDILPTVLLLVIMALCMSAFARYAESSHFKPVSDIDITLLKVSD